MRMGHVPMVFAVGMFTWMMRTITMITICIMDLRHREYIMKIPSITTAANPTDTLRLPW